MRTAGLNRRIRLLRHRMLGRTSGKRGAPLLPAVLLLVAVLSVVILSRLQPIVIQMAEYSVGDEVTELVNEAIAEKVLDESLNYKNLVTLETDSEGNISALRTNMAEINLLKSEITAYVIDSLSKHMTSVIKIPIGNVLGGPILSGRGPCIPVKIVSVTNISAEFSNEFLSAGINQTRHQIILSITVDTEALIPGKTIIDTVTTSMVVAETVIVGAVPNTYAYLK